MSQMTALTPQHSILKSARRGPVAPAASGKVVPKVSFETADVAPVSEAYRNFMNNTRQRDIDAYRKLSNPYYISPSFNKPFLSFDFKTPGYSKKASANTFLVLLKLNVPETRSHHHEHRPLVDELSVQALAYTVKKLARDYDEIYIISVVSKFELAYEGKGYYLAESERTRYKALLNNELVPMLKARVLESLGDEDGAADKQFSISLNILFDHNVTLTVQTAVIDFSPNAVILSHHEDDDEGHASRKPRFLQRLASTNSITNYCLKKINNPIIIFTNNAIKPHRLDQLSLGLGQSVDEKLAAANHVQDDYFVNLVKAVPTDTLPESRSVSRSASRSRSHARNDNSGAASKSSSLFRSPGSSRSSSRHKDPPSLSPAASSHHLVPFRSSDALRPLRSNERSTLAPHKSADAALLQKARKSNKKTKMVTNSNYNTERRGSSIREEEGADVVRDKLKRSFPSFFRFRHKLGSQ